MHEPNDFIEAGDESSLVANNSQLLLVELLGLNQLLGGERGHLRQRGFNSRL
ncbi:MAG: hypothetical protein ACREMQ_00990 [Longimicrobiales bacterium]